MDAPEFSPSQALVRCNSSPAILQTETPQIGELAQIVETVTRVVRETFVDGDHIWKQEVYRLVLAEMRGALGPMALTNGTRLDNMTSLCVTELSRSEGHPRDQYVRFVLALRDALACAEGVPGSDPTVQLLMRVCHARFTSVYIFSFLASLVDMMIDAGMTDRQAYEQAPLWDAIRMEIEAIDNAPSDYKAPRAAVLLGCLQGTININFDPHLQRNKPYVLADIFVGGRTIHWCRFGSPTVEGYVQYASIITEFRWYLRGLQAQNLVHLYVNLQNLEAKWLGNEQGRSEAIGELQREFPNTFFCMTLAQDSKFYRQEGRHADPELSYIKFRKRFIDQVFREAGERRGFSLPEPLINEQFRGAVGQVMDALKADLGFGNILTRDERLDFIEIYNALLTLLAIRELRPDFLNIACKDAIDRAAKNGTVLYYLIALLQGRENDPQLREELRVFAHAAALIVKKQGIAPSRRDRLISALKRMFECRTWTHLQALRLVDATPPQIRRNEEQKLRTLSEIQNLLRRSWN